MYADGDLRYEYAGAETSITINGKQVVTSRHCSVKNTTIILFCADVGLVRVCVCMCMYVYVCMYV